MLAAPHRGATIDISNFGGGRCRTCRQHPPRGPHIGVFNFGGGRYRTCQQHPPGSPPSTSSTSVVVVTEHVGSTPRGPVIDVFKFRWWALPDLPATPPESPPSMTSPTLVLAAAGHADSTHRGPAIDGCCRTYRQHPQGPAIHVSNFRTSSSGTSQGPVVNAFLSVDGGRSRNSSFDTSPRGSIVDRRVKSSR
jgi:hypothetical protein